MERERRHEEYKLGLSRNSKWESQGGEKNHPKGSEKTHISREPLNTNPRQEKKTRGYKDIVGLKSIKNQIIKCNTKDQIAEDKKGDLD